LPDIKSEVLEIGTKKAHEKIVTQAQNKRKFVE
jgi:hypothetical protein